VQKGIANNIRNVLDFFIFIFFVFLVNRYYFSFILANDQKYLYRKVYLMMSVNKKDDIYHDIGHMYQYICGDS